jgi:UDP-glucuronate 4-epimerase
MSLRRVLVTGAAGFIGSAISKELALQGNELLGVDNFNDYYSPHLKRQREEVFLKNFGVELLEGDISDKNFVSELISKFKPDSVIHLAAQAGVRLPFDSYQNYIKSNVVGFFNVFQSSAINKVETFLYASSSSVYGSQAQTPFEEKEVNLYPTSFYGETKLFNERMISHLSKATEMKIRGVRFFTVYGPWGRPDMAYFKLFFSAYKKAPFALFGDGNIARDFTYIGDVVNIGGGKPRSILDLIQNIKNISGKDIEIKVSNSIPEDMQVTCSSSEYLESLIGKCTFVGLQEGLIKVNNWIKDSITSGDFQKYSIDEKF